jgi:hypothetical protein
MNLEPSPALEPGRRAYAMAVKLRRARMRRWLMLAHIRRGA